MCPGTKRKAFRKETPEEKAARDRAAKKRLIDGLWLAAAAKTTLTVSQSGDNTSRPEEVCSTSSRNRVESLSQPKPVGKKGRTANKSKIQLDKQSKAEKSDSRLAKMWAAQVSTRTVQTPDG